MDSTLDMEDSVLRLSALAAVSPSEAAVLIARGRLPKEDTCMSLAPRQAAISKAKQGGRTCIRRDTMLMAAPKPCPDSKEDVQDEMMLWQPAAASAIHVGEGQDALELQDILRQSNSWTEQC